jgi:dihydrolipoamide dehydrogenase
MEMKKFDLAVLGAGPGGYPAAIKAAQLGLKVALIEAKEVGGTCLNRGCIPSKTLIANAELLEQCRTAKHFGIEIGKIAFDFTQMANRKNLIVDQMRKNVEHLIASNGITLVQGFGRLQSRNEIKVTGKDSQILWADKIIIATGSEPRNISAFPCDGELILDSTSLLNLKKLPKSMTIIGGGVIGCEFASLYAYLGVEITIVELLPALLPLESQMISQTLTQSFIKRGIKIHTKAKVEKIERKDKGVSIHIEGKDAVQSDVALVAVGRSLNTRDIGLEKAGLSTNEQGFIHVNDKMETNVDGMYAIGDITNPLWLAHVATHQGIVAASNAAGHKSRMYYDAIPMVIYTHPEIATVGLSQEKAKEKGYQVSIGSIPFSALGKAQASGHTEGFVQIVTDKSTGQILGAQAIGYEASTLIAEMALAIANELTLECVMDTIHAHPTLPEVWMEAAFMANETPLHLPLRKRT